MSAITIERYPCEVYVCPLRTFVGYVTNLGGEVEIDEYIESRPKRYLTVNEEGEKVVKEFDLLEWTLNEIETQKYLLKEDFIDALAAEGIDVFTYKREEFIWEDYQPKENHLKFMCILKAYWDLRNHYFYYTNEEIEETFGFENVEQMLQEMMEEKLIAMDVLEGHPEIRNIWDNCSW